MFLIYFFYLFLCFFFFNFFIKIYYFILFLFSTMAAMGHHTWYLDKPKLQNVISIKSFLLITLQKFILSFGNVKLLLKIKCQFFLNNSTNNW